jgi:hypothetical protein
MGNIIAFPRLQADTCRLHNRQPELKEQRRCLEIEFELAPEPEPDRYWPTPFGWALIGLAYFNAVKRR